MLHVCEQSLRGSLIIVVILDDSFIPVFRSYYFCIEGFYMTWFHYFEWERQKNERNKDKGKRRREINDKAVVQCGGNPNRGQNRWSRFNRNTKA